MNLIMDITCFLLSLFGLQIASAVEQEILVDTLLDNSGKWTGWVKNTDKFTGWKISNSGLISSMTYMVCDISSSGTVDYWLRSPYIDVQDSRAIIVEVHFMMRSCAMHPNPTSLTRCKETVDLMIFESKRNSSSDLSLAKQLNSTYYRKADTIAPHIKWETPPTDMKSITNVLRYSIKLQRPAIFIAFRDTGSCVTLLRSRIYYNVCPQIVNNYTIFDRTPAAHLGDVVSVKGSCVKGAETVSGGSPPTKICKSNGEWFENNNGRCHCSAGYYPQGTKNCDACPVNSYKPTAGNYMCLNCPSESYTPSHGSTSCPCRESFFRNPDKGDGLNSSCTQPPSAPREAIVRVNSLAKVVISWSPPVNTGGRSDLEYFVECDACPSGGLRYQPNQQLKDNLVTILGLQPLTKYNFKIYALNGVSKIAREERSRWTMVPVQTSASLPNKPEALRVVIVDATTVRVTWDRPLNTAIEEYEVRVQPKEDPSKTSYFFTTSEEYFVRNLAIGATYLLQVRGKTALGWGDYSEVVTANTENSALGQKDPDTTENSTPAESSVNIIVAAVVAVLLCLIIVLTMIILMIRRGYWFGLKRNKMMCEKSPSSDCNMIPYNNIPFLYGPRDTLTMGFQLPPATKSYVDPHTYEDPCQAVHDFAKEIDASCIAIECVLGGGEFGDVCKGIMRIPGRADQRVAIKTLKPGASEKNRLDFLTEASIMAQFDNANVIHLEGVATRSHPIMIVTEYMANGSLDSFLRAHDAEFSCHQLVCMLRGIANGMRYLSDKGYIHRDLAARNILVNESLVCKVADFGLSREIEMTDSKDGTYTTRGGKIPVRWTSPEAIHFRKFTSASDVWSFAVVMWEVMSFGERPYWNWSNHDVIAAIENSYRLPPPMDCPESVHRLMLQCWAWERTERPKFPQIVHALDCMIRQPELLMNHTPRPVYEAPAAMTMQTRRYANVTQWLSKLNLERYGDCFYRYGVVSMETVPRLTLSDLISMGISVPSHQTKLLNAIQNLKVHLYDATPYSDNYLV